MGSNIENTTTGLNWLEKVLETVKKYHIWDFCKAFVVILFTALIVGFISNPFGLFEKFKEWEEQQHQKEMVYRLENTAKIQSSLDKLLYKTDASRVVYLEMQNGSKSIGGLPFIKATATFESLADETHPISSQYQEVNLSLIPFADFLFKKHYWCGDTEDMKTIDKSLCYRMLSNETTHFAGCVVEGVDGAIGFLFVSFNKTDEEHNCKEVERMINHTALEIAVYLELKKYK